MRKFILALGLLLAATVTAGTQSTPGFRQGQVPTAAQWNAAFGAKQDYLGSLTAVPLNSGNIFYGVSNVAVSMLPTQAFDATFCATRGALLSRQVASWACLGVGTSGQALISGGAGADPAFGAIGVAGGGTGATTLTAHGMLIGQGTSAITSLPCAVNQVMQWPSGTGSDPACTSTPIFGANGGTGGQITFNGSTSGSVALKVAAAAGTATIFQMPATNGSSGQFLTTNGSGVTSWAATSANPTVQRFTSGTGTYTPAANTVRIRVRMVGGGGGGGANSSNNGSNGTDTSFGTWTAIHGNGGVLGTPNTGGTGGTGGVDGTGTVIARFSGANGGVSSTIGTQYGASSLFGGGGSSVNSSSSAGKTNTGSGGSGALSNGTGGGSGGGAGEYVEFWMTAAQVGASLTYTVGGGGNGGAAGGVAGGNGAAGIIIVEESY